MRCLRGKPAQEIIRNQDAAIQFPNIYPFSPTLDGSFLTDAPINLLISGKFKDVPVLIGSTEDEGNW